VWNQGSAYNDFINPEYEAEINSRSSQ